VDEEEEEREATGRNGAAVAVGGGSEAFLLADRSSSKWMLTSPHYPLAQSALASCPSLSSTWPGSGARSNGKPRMLGKTTCLHPTSPLILTPLSQPRSRPSPPTTTRGYF